MGAHFDANESASISDSGSTSDCSLSSMDLAAQEGASFKLPAKGRSSKPKIFESNAGRISESFQVSRRRYPGK